MGECPSRKRRVRLRRVCCHHQPQQERKKQQQEIALAPESRLFSVVGMSRGVGEFFKKQQLNGLKCVVTRVT